MTYDNVGYLLAIHSYHKLRHVGAIIALAFICRKNGTEKRVNNWDKPSWHIACEW